MSRSPSVVVLVAALVHASCVASTPPPPPAIRPIAPTVEPPPPTRVVQPPPVRAREDFAVGDAPMSLVVSGRSLIWSDVLGSIWSMPSDGSEPPRQLSDARRPNFAFRLFRAGDHVFATGRGDLIRVAGPAGPVTAVGAKGLRDNAEESTGDDEAIYLTVFKRQEVLRLPLATAKAEILTRVPRGVLGVHAGTLYVASYSTNVLIAIPTRGGAKRTLATNLARPTAVAADDTHVFVYGERDKAVRAIDLTTGAQRVIATGLVNSDDLVSDGPWLYAFSWGKRPSLVRIAKDGSRPVQVIADDLESPYRIAVDDDAIYVTSRAQDKIVKFAKAALPAR